MTNWLRNRLVVWGAFSLLGGALLWNSGTLQAQTYFKTYWDAKTPRPRLTKEQAANRFAEYIDMRFRALDRIYEYEAPDFNEKRKEKLKVELPVIESISTKSVRELNSDFRIVLEALVEQWAIADQTVNTQSGDEKSATVTLQVTTKPFVLVQDNGGWGIDLIETYAKWNKLEGPAKLEAIAKLTGVRLEGVPESPEANRSYCLSNMAQLARSVAQYSQDYNEKLPLIKSWEKGVDPYVRSRLLYNCPGLPQGQGHGYAYNSKLSNRELVDFTDFKKTVALYETSVLKPNAVGGGENAAFRHGGGAHYGFLDGHAKWYPKGAKLRFGVR